MPVRCRTGISHKWPTKFKTRPGPPTVKLSVRPGDKKCRDVRDGTGLERYITCEYACCSCYILLTVRREDRRRGRDEYFRDAITLTAAAFSWRLAKTFLDTKKLKRDVTQKGSWRRVETRFPYSLCPVANRASRGSIMEWTASFYPTLQPTVSPPLSSSSLIPTSSTVQNVSLILLSHTQALICVPGQISMEQLRPPPRPS